MAENLLSNPKLSNEDRTFLENSKNEQDFIDRLTQLDLGLEIALGAEKAKKILEKVDLLNKEGDPELTEIRYIIDVVYNTDQEELDKQMIEYDEMIHEAFYKGASYIYANSNGLFKGKIIPKVSKVNKRVGEDFKSAGHIEEGSIINGLIRLFKKVFK